MFSFIKYSKKFKNLLRQWIGGGLGDFVQNVAVGVVKWLIHPWNQHHRVFVISPCTIGVDGHFDAKFHRFEGVFQKWFY